MRYRPIGPSGAVISAVSLSLRADPARPRPADWVSFLYAALENGISGFEVDGADRVLAEGLAQALAGIERRLIFVAWRIGKGARGGARARDLSGAALGREVRQALAMSGLTYLDAVLIDDPATSEIHPETFDSLKQLKAAGLVRFVGVAGEGTSIDGHVGSGGFDLLATGFSLTSGWRERNLLRAAVAGDMAVLGHGPYPAELRALAAAGRPAVSRDHPLAGVGRYGFLTETRGWGAEEICLAYAMTEPALASVVVHAASLGDLERLAAVADREMPPGLAAQVEMARFSPAAEADPRRRA